MEKQNKYNIDILRIVAIWMVIYNHTGTLGYLNFIEKQNSRYFYFYMAFSILIKIAVPLFWMISGALLLNKDETLFMVIKKRIVRFVLVLILFSFVQYVYNYFQGDYGAIFSLVKFIYKIYTDNIVGSYWYLYMYLGYLIMLPFLRRMVRGMQKTDYAYLLVVSLFFSAIIPTFEFICLKNEIQFSISFQIPIFLCNCIIFPIMGHYLENVKKREEFTVLGLVTLICLSLFVIGLECLLTSINCRGIDDWENIQIERFFNYFIIIPTYTFFYGVKFWSIHGFTSGRFNRIVKGLGAGTFGVYLIENIIRKNTYEIYSWFRNYFSNFISAILWVTCILAMSLIVVYVLKRIPLLKRLI